MKLENLENTQFMPAGHNPYHHDYFSVGASLPSTDRVEVLTSMNLPDPDRKLRYSITLVDKITGKAVHGTLVLDPIEDEDEGEECGAPELLVHFLGAADGE